MSKAFKPKVEKPKKVAPVQDATAIAATNRGASGRAIIAARNDDTQTKKRILG